MKSILRQNFNIGIVLFLLVFGSLCAAQTSEIDRGNSELVKGNYAAALAAFKKAESVYRSQLQSHPDDKALQNGLARALGSMGVVYMQQSNYYSALDFYQKALALYEKAGDRKSISKALNNIGIVYKSQSEQEKALAYYKKALKVQQEIGDGNAGITMTNIGVIYFEEGDNASALQYFKDAEKGFEKADNPYGKALLDTAFGDFYRKQNNGALAKSYYQKALGIYETMQDKFDASLVLYHLGQTFFEEKKYDEAMPYASKSLAYASEIGTGDQTYHSEKLLSDLYGALNNTAESYAHYKKYIAAKERVINQENSKKFALAAMDFEYKKKAALLIEENKRQTQLILFSILGGLLLIVLVLVIHNKRQVKRRLTLQKEVAEYEQKALHLQMNPHFVFNCLGAISSFIVQNGTDTALKYLSKFSKLMRLTLEYSKGSLIPIDKEIESLQNYLELEQLRFNNKFEFEITASDKVEFNMGLPPLLIQPFVENAILHGMVPKEGNGRIDVDFDVADGQFVCMISDNGIGISESKLLKENSVTAHKSMALEITKKRLEIMESTTSKTAQIDITEINNGQRTGTRVTLRLPIQYIQ